jgi:hypothetical protein
VTYISLGDIDHMLIGILHARELVGLAALTQQHGGDGEHNAQDDEYDHRYGHLYNHFVNFVKKKLSTCC